MDTLADSFGCLKTSMENYLILKFMLDYMLPSKVLVEGLQICGIFHFQIDGCTQLSAYCCNLNHWLWVSLVLNWSERLMGTKLIFRLPAYAERSTDTRSFIVAAIIIVVMNELHSWNMVSLKSSQGTNSTPAAATEAKFARLMNLLRRDAIHPDVDTVSIQND